MRDFDKAVAKDLALLKQSMLINRDGLIISLVGNALLMLAVGWLLTKVVV